LDRAGGDLTFSPEPVQEKLFMSAEHPRHFLHRLKSAAHGPFTPDIQESSRPSQRAVTPEVSERLLEHPGPARCEIGAQQPVEPLLGLTADAVATSEQLPAHALESVGGRAPSQSSGLTAPYLIHRLVQMHG